MINFMRYKWFFFLFSALVIGPGLISLVLFGLKPSIDFTGGTLWEIEVSQQSAANNEQVEQVLEEEGFSSEVQSSGENRFLIRTMPLDVSQKNLISGELLKVVGEFAEIRFETLGPRIGRELLQKALLGVVLAIFALAAYIAYRFANIVYGLAAILAVFHDMLVLLGTFSLFRYFFWVEIDTLFVTAVLTTLSFSVHDTIVAFDRIREIGRKTAESNLEQVVNQAVGETLVRSLNNSLTIIFMLTALFVLGGETLRWFVFALLVGTITGTYSSTFTAAPLLLVLKSLRGKTLGNS